jgi:hypothetical protein
MQEMQMLSAKLQSAEEEIAQLQTALADHDEQRKIDASKHARSIKVVGTCLKRKLLTAHLATGADQAAAIADKTHSRCSISISFGVSVAITPRKRYCPPP